jgi:thymidylate synthase (FAD)
METIRLNMNHEKIFNNGFIELVDSMGNDLRVSNCARVSFDICKFDFDGSDEKLIKYLARNQHWSPFRHVQFTFMCQLPEIVTRQFYKHVVGVAYSEHGTREIDHAWNEVSGRYIEATKLGFWIPDKLRLQSPSNKQGSMDDLEGRLSPDLIEDMVRHCEESEALYGRLIAAGVAKEIARSVLPTAFNTKFIWTCSLQALVNFIKLRLHSHAQKEIQMVAEILLKLARPICPHSIDALLEKS